METVLIVVAFGVLVASSGYFAGIETGLYCINRLRHRIRMRQGDARASSVDALLARPERLICTSLVGHNICSFAVTSMVTVLFVRWLGEASAAGAGAGGLTAAGAAAAYGSSGARAEVLTTLFLSPFLFVFAECVPKDVFRRHADALVYRLSASTHLVTRLLRPLSWPLEVISSFLVRLGLRGESRSEGVPGADVLFHVVAAGTEAGVLTEYQDRMARNVVALRGRLLTEVMIPARRAVLVPFGSTIADAKEVARGNEVSRLPVRGRKPGEWVGVVNTFDLWFAAEPDEPIAELVREVPSLAPGSTVEQAIGVIRRSGQPMGFVVQGGRAVGLVTLKDLVEEIVGELRDL